MPIPIVKVTVNEVGKNFKNHQKEFVTILAQTHLETLSKATAEKMREVIRDSSIRPGATGNLASNIKAEYIDSFTWGVGKVEDLNKNAPYWRHINYGSIAIGAKYQHQLPQGTFQPGVAIPTPGLQDGRWSLFKNVGGQRYAPFVKKPIPAKNYIEKTLAWALTNLKSIFRRR